MPGPVRFCAMTEKHPFHESMQILSAVWGYEHDPTTNIVDVYIGYLRRKLNLPDNPAPIFTVRSVGYRLGNAAQPSSFEAGSVTPEGSTDATRGPPHCEGSVGGHTPRRPPPPTR